MVGFTHFTIYRWILLSVLLTPCRRQNPNVSAAAGRRLRLQGTRKTPESFLFWNIGRASEPNRFGADVFLASLFTDNSQRGTAMLNFSGRRLPALAQYSKREAASVITNFRLTALRMAASAKRSLGESPALPASKAEIVKSAERGFKKTSGRCSSVAPIKAEVVKSAERGFKKTFRLRSSHARAAIRCRSQQVLRASARCRPEAAR